MNKKEACPSGWRSSPAKTVYDNISQVRILLFSGKIKTKILDIGLYWSFPSSPCMELVI